MRWTQAIVACVCIALVADTQAEATSDAQLQSPDAIFNCPIFTDCDSCFAASPQSAAAVDAAAATPVATRSGPCGWCVSSWSCMTGDIHGPTAPQVCAQANLNWNYDTCDLVDNCGGLYCNRLQTCDRDTAPDGSQTTFKCRTSAVTIVWSVLLCVFVCCVLPLSIWYFRRRAKRQSQYASYYYDDRDAHYQDAAADAHTILPAQLQPSTAYQQTWPQQQTQQQQQQQRQAAQPYANSYAIPTAM